jgi:hypothetical protein
VIWEGRSAICERASDEKAYLANLSRGSAEELRPKPDEEERDDLSEVEERRGTPKGEDGEPVRRLDDVGRLAAGARKGQLGEGSARRRKGSQLVGNGLDIIPDLGSIGLAIDLDVELHGCRWREMKGQLRSARKNAEPREKKLTDLHSDSKDGEDEELSDEEEGRVTCRDDAVGLRVSGASLKTGDPSASEEGVSF